MDNLTVCWLSAGVSSFVAGWLARDSIDKFIYIDIADQHKDSIRFIKDCENVLGQKVEIIKSDQYDCVADVCRAFRFINSAYGTKCTDVLKRRVRKKFEYEHRDKYISYVWGMDLNEKHRADRLIETMPDYDHIFPLIEHNLTKEDAHGICKQLGIQRPVMYDLGYSNNNCVGCLKGGAGYWNKIRKDFPDVFESRAKLEREVGHSILRNRKTGGSLYLDELDPRSGRMEHEIMEECGIFCQMALD